jgi:SAM-dependent methyltransferase
MGNLYTPDYYERGVEVGLSLYSNYRWMPELTIPMAHEITTQLGIEDNELILDFGCAKGYLVKALRLLHFEHAHGSDISGYAIRCAPQDVEDHVIEYDGVPRPQSFGLTDGWDWVIAKDVLEHIGKEELAHILRAAATFSINLFAIIPLAEDGKYVVPAYEMDKTHIIREDREWWEDMFRGNGWEPTWSTGSMRHIKENYAGYPGGNLFITATSQEKL